MNLANLCQVFTELPRQCYERGLEPVCWLLGRDGAEAVAMHQEEIMGCGGLIVGLPFKMMHDRSRDGIALAFEDPAAEIVDSHELFSL